MKVKGKLQIPSSNIQRSSKLQAPIVVARFWIWSLVIEVSLELGCWCLGFHILNRKPNRLAGRGRGERDFAFAGTKRRHRVANRLAHGNRQHQRRFAHGFAAVNHIFLRRVLEQRHVENLRRVADGRDFVSVRRVRQQPALVVPLEFLGRQPAHALHKAAFDLPAVDAFVHRVARVVQNVHAQYPVHAGETVHFHFRHRRAVWRNNETACLDPPRDRNEFPAWHNSPSPTNSRARGGPSCTTSAKETFASGSSRWKTNPLAKTKSSVAADVSEALINFRILV